MATDTIAIDKISDAAVGVQAGMLLGEVLEAGDTPFVRLPAGAQVHSLEALLPKPARPRGTVRLHDWRSFCAVVMARTHDNLVTLTSHDDAGAVTGTSRAYRQLRIYGQLDPKPSFTAVFNDHDGGDAGWRDDRAVFDCPLSTEWTRWLGQSGKVMTQEAFATWIEDNLPDIATPPAADMLEISRSLEAKKKVNFASGLRLSNGQNQLTYEETIEGTAAKGRLTVPETFSIGIPVLEGGHRYQVEARLRYRIADGGKLSMWYDLLRPHKILEDAVDSVWQAIEAELGATIVHGVIEK